tara:strand:- start:112 stop:726 length:615 start_codon:yes stop_codon:yes gene_type:complete
MWSQRLNSRSAFGRACKELTKGWRGGHNIAPNVQQEILEGFRKFYDKRHWKYKLIENATGIAYVNTIANSTAFAVISPDGTLTTVSRHCYRVNIRRDIIEACRGSIHYEQILSIKKKKGNQIDHYNVGGFAAIFEDWVKDKNMNDLYTQVIHNDPLRNSTKRDGFKTFKEPLLTEWKIFHKAHAKLQELTPTEHMELTRDRLNV